MNGKSRVTRFLVVPSGYPFDEMKMVESLISFIPGTPLEESRDICWWIWYKALYF